MFARRAYRYTVTNISVIAVVSHNKRLVNCWTRVGDDERGESLGKGVVGIDDVDDEMCCSMRGGRRRRQWISQRRKRLGS